MADTPATPPQNKRKLIASAQLIEANLIELMQEGTSDAARVSAAKALMEMVRYMNGENDKAERSDDKQRVDAIREARRLLAEFAALKFGGAASAGSARVDQPHDVAGARAAQSDNPAG